MLESIQSILDEPWKPISRPALVAWLIFYVGFLGYAFSAHGGFLFIDNANLVVHLQASHAVAAPTKIGGR
jgi:hypothetical protein